MFLAIAIIVIGAVFLLQNLGIISSNVWSIIWPALLIIAGISMICKNQGCCFCGCKCGDDCKCEEKK